MKLELETACKWNRLRFSPHIFPIIVGKSWVGEELVVDVYVEWFMLCLSRLPSTQNPKLCPADQALMLSDHSAIEYPIVGECRSLPVWIKAWHHVEVF